ncbi:MAG: hypothetical protein ABH887_02010 [bacterium]
MKTIHIEPDEEIISVIDKIDRANDRQINLVIPNGAQIWQSSINLKLLMREANYASQKINLIIPSNLDSEMAEKIGFTVKKVDDITEEVELINDQNIKQEENNIGVELATSVEGLVDQMPMQDVDMDSDDIKKEILEEEDQEENDQEEEFNESRSQDVKDNMINILVDELQTNGSKNRFNNSFKQDVMKNKADLVVARKGQITNKKRVAKKSLRSKIGKLPVMPASFSMQKRNSNSKRYESKQYKKSVPNAPINWNKWFAGFIALGLVVVLLVLFFVLPTTTVNIYPQTEPISFDLSIKGLRSATNVDVNTNTVPIQEMSVKQNVSKSFSTTGEKELNEKASGIITVYNEFSSVPQTIVATTRFESPDGKIFRLLKTTVIPGAKIEDAKIVPSTINIEVVADQPGSDYNIDPTEFTIPGFKGSPKYVGFYGKSNKAMDGGAIGKFKVVLDEDIENAKKSLTEELINNAKVDLQRQIPEGFEIIENGMQENILQEDFSAKEGDQAELFTLEIEAEVKALLLKIDDVKQIIDLNLLSMIDEDKKILADSQEYDVENLDINQDTSEVDIDLSARADAVSDIDIMLLKEELSGKNEVEVRRYFANHSEIQKADFSFWPFWVKKITKRLDRIKININYDKL